MKIPILWVAGLVLSAADPLFAQTLLGTWQGIIQSPQASGGQFRTVIRISTTGSNALSAIMYSIDVSGRRFAASAVSSQGSFVKISIPAAGNAFEGKLSADGNTMTGAWQGQGPGPQQVTFTRATPETAWAIPDPPAPLKAMPADADPSFDVSIVKPSPPDATGMRLGIDRSGRLTVRNYRLEDLVAFAYRLHPRQIKGIPDGLASERFDIQAKPDTAGEPSDMQFRFMLQKLLAERFLVTAHREKKELTVYAVTVAKTGPKLTKTQSNSALPSFGGRPGRETCTNSTVGDFASYLQGVVLDRPVVDQSGLEGRYDFTLNWTPDESQFVGLAVPAPSGPNTEAFPDLFTAIQRQLGLKLESVKAPVDVLVIDRIEKPTEN